MRRAGAFGPPASGPVSRSCENMQKGAAYEIRCGLIGFHFFWCRVNPAYGRAPKQSLAALGTLALRTMNHPKLDRLHLTLADSISDQIEQRHASELRAVLSTGNEITMHGTFTIGTDFIIYRTAKDATGKWAMTPFAHIVQLII